MNGEIKLFIETARKNKKRATECLDYMQSEHLGISRIADALRVALGRESLYTTQEGWERELHEREKKYIATF